MRRRIITIIIIIITTTTTTTHDSLLAEKQFYSLQYMQRETDVYWSLF